MPDGSKIILPMKSGTRIGKVVASEMFTTLHVVPKNPNSAEDANAFLAAPAPGYFGRDRWVRWEELACEDATAGIKEAEQSKPRDRQTIRDGAAVLTNAMELESAVEGGDLDAAINCALRLQSAYDRYLLRRHEPNAEIGRETRQSNARTAKDRWNTPARGAERASWIATANRLREKHPDWSHAAIARAVKGKHPSNHSDKTYLRAIKK
jgi:hypothetical protein